MRVRKWFTIGIICIGTVVAKVMIGFVMSHFQKQRISYSVQVVLSRTSYENPHLETTLIKKGHEVGSISKRVHPEKKGIRVFAIAESFKKSHEKSVLAGVVMRRDLVIDGMAFGKATIKGDDATDSIISMLQSLGRDDVNCIIIDGLVISMFNIIDGESISRKTALPVIAVTFEDSKGLEGNIRRRFPESWQAKMEKYKELGRRERIVLKTGKSLYILFWGLSQRHAISLLNAFTLQGSIPEPVRVAKLAARAALML